MKLKDLIKATSSVRKNQYSSAKVGQVDFKYVAKTNQLYVSAIAFPSDPARKSPYKISLVFDKVTNSPSITNKHIIPYASKPGQVDFYIEQITDSHNVRVRCQCPDYYFMWQYYNKSNKSLIGPHKNYTRKTSHYPPRNPGEVPGLCKHQLKLIKLLIDQGILKSTSRSKQVVSRKPKIV